MIAAAADRRGRRRVLLWSAVAGCVVTATGALAPNLAALGVSQTVARAFSTALVLVISIIAVEEMPAGSRAFAVSVLSATGALGAGFAVMLVTVAGFGPAAWRILFLVPLAAVPVVAAAGPPDPRDPAGSPRPTTGADARRRRGRRAAGDSRPASTGAGSLLLSASGLACRCSCCRRRRSSTSTCAPSGASRPARSPCSRSSPTRPAGSASWSAASWPTGAAGG